MKKILASAAMVSLLLGAAPTIAKQKQDRSPPILVDAGNLTAQWADDVSEDLDRSLQAIRISPRDVLPNGIAQVRFEVQNGEAVNVRLFRASGDRWLDRMAMRSVERLDRIPDVPNTIGEGQTVQANIITARSDEAYAELADELRDIEETRMASSGPDRTVIALNPGRRTAG